VVTVGVDYDANLDQVYQVIHETGQKLKELDNYVLEPTTAQGVEAFGDSAVMIRTVTKVKPGHHFRVELEFRKLLKEAFDYAGIEIPFSQHVIMFKPNNIITPNDFVNLSKV